MIKSFQKITKGTITYNGLAFESFGICCRVKQGCVLAPTLFGICFMVLLKHVFGSATEVILLKTRLDDSLFNLLRLKMKSKCEMKCHCEFLFPDDVTIKSYSSEDLQHLMNRLHTVCQWFGLKISLRNTQMLGQGVNEPPSFSFSGQKLDTVHDIIYLGSTISDSITKDKEISRLIGKATNTMSKLRKWVWSNQMLTMHTTIHLYRACMLSTLLYAGEMWTLYSCQEK